MEKQAKKPVGQLKREKENKETMEVLFMKWLSTKKIMKVLTLKRLSLCHELEIREYYATHKNYKETTRVFGLHDSTVREICKAATKTNKGRFGALKRSKETKKEQENVYLI